MNKSILAAAITTLLPAVTLADTVGFKVGAYQWQQDYEGQITTEGELNNVDLQDDLGFDDEDGKTYFIALEHPVPVIPNILLSKTEMEIQSASTLSRSVTFDGKTYTASTDVSSDVDLSHTDITLYYEVLDNWVNLDIGLTARIFDGGFSISDNSQTASEDFDHAIPLLYIATRFDLPLTGLYIGASANGLTYSDASLIDYQVNVGYESSIGLGVELGLRKFDIDYEDDEDQADLTVDGGYLGVYYHF